MTANGSGSRIRVFDESGEWIGTTYPKRARGLVKNGRARWLADTPNASDPVPMPDSIVLIRNTAGAEEDLPAQNGTTNEKENIMNEFNNNSNNGKTENELRIEALIAKFKEDMAKARETAEKAAAEAREAMEKTRAEGEEGGKTVCETLTELGAKLNEAAETVCGEIRTAAAEIAENKNVRETAETVKNAGGAILSDAKKKLREAEERLAEARRAYEDAERKAAEAGDEAGTEKQAPEAEEDAGGAEDDAAARVKENLRQLADEAGEALHVAWTELKKGWKELSEASAGSFEWLKENTKDARENVKDALREFGESVKTMMDDVGSCGECGEDGKDEEIEKTCGECEEPGTEVDIEEAGEPEAPEATAVTGTNDAVRAEAATAARKSIEDEIASVKERVNGILALMKDKCASGEITVEQYMEYTDKYTSYLDDRLAELREELKNI